MFIQDLFSSIFDALPEKILSFHLITIFFIVLFNTCRNLKFCVKGEYKRSCHLVPLDRGSSRAAASWGHVNLFYEFSTCSIVWQKQINDSKQHRGSGNSYIILASM